PSSPALSPMPLDATGRTMHRLRNQPPVTRGNMRLTTRCLGLLRLIRAARWLSTGQIQRRFFPLATTDAVRKRLRKLTSTGYLVVVRRDRMSQAIFTIGPEGKRTLEMVDGDAVTIDRKPPIQRE